MCDPISMTAVTVASTAAGLAGAGVNAYGQMQGAHANKENLYYQAQVAANNAKIAQQNAEQEIQTGETQVGIQGMKNRATLGATKAGQAASGVDVNSGSSVAVRAGESEVGALDAATIRSNAARKAYGFQVGAASDLAQSQLDIAGGKQASAAGSTAAIGSLLSGASSVGGKFAGWLNANGGAPGGGGSGSDGI